MSGPFKMKGHSLPGPNQASPAKEKMEKIPSKKAQYLSTTKEGNKLAKFGVKPSKKSDERYRDREGSDIVNEQNQGSKQSKVSSGRRHRESVLNKAKE